MAHLLGRPSRFKAISCTLLFALSQSTQQLMDIWLEAGGHIVLARPFSNVSFSNARLTKDLQCNEIKFTLFSA